MICKCGAEMTVLHLMGSVPLWLCPKCSYDPDDHKCPECEAPCSCGRHRCMHCNKADQDDARMERIESCRNPD
jgi:hypothetical protein